MRAEIARLLSRYCRATNQSKAAYRRAKAQWPTLAPDQQRIAKRRMEDAVAFFEEGLARGKPERPAIELVK